MSAYADRPNVIPWPPIILIGCIAIGWLLMQWTAFPITEQFNPTMRMIGTLMIALAIALDIWTMVTFRKHNTTVRPDRAASTLCKRGPFAISRNPIYLANVVIIAGLALRWNSWWLIAMALICGVAVQEFAIKREEAHLSAKFGDEWDHYASIVRRWF